MTKARLESAASINVNMNVSVGVNVSVSANIGVRREIRMSTTWYLVKYDETDILGISVPTSSDDNDVDRIMSEWN
jgi:hypothetical protein